MVSLMTQIPRKDPSVVIKKKKCSRVENAWYYDQLSSDSMFYFYERWLFPPCRGKDWKGHQHLFVPSPFLFSPPPCCCTQSSIHNPHCNAPSHPPPCISISNLLVCHYLLPFLKTLWCWTNMLHIMLILWLLPDWLALSPNHCLSRKIPNALWIVTFVLHFPILILIISASPHGPGLCTFILTLASLLLIGVTLPFSLVFCLKVIFFIIDILLLTIRAF